MEPIHEPSQTTDPTEYMDLPSLLALGGDSLFHQTLCMGDDLPLLRCLRQVSKQVGSRALQALSKYTLTLKGGDKDTNVNGAILLRLTTLIQLTVHLRLTGSYSPAILLRGFVQEVGTALATVTHLDLHVKDTGSSMATRSSLTTAITTLLAACHALVTLRCSKQCLSPALVQAAGERCPHLTTLDLNMGGASEAQNLQNLGNVLPDLCPHLNQLILRGLGYSLPDLSEHIGIITLVLRGFKFPDASAWFRLPPKLRTLDCEGFQTGPSAKSTNGTAFLHSLVTVIVGHRLTYTSLHSLAQLLQAAPALKVVKSEGGQYAGVLIQCKLGPTTAGDCSVVLARMDLELVMKADYTFEYGNDDDQEVFQPFIASMPSMTGITRCGLEFCTPANVSLLLGRFPDVQQLYFSSQKLDDLGLFDVASCAQLRTLHLNNCNNVTPMGVAMLCKQSPTLCAVTCTGCTNLQPAGLEKCAQLLKKYGRVVEFHDL